LTALGTVCALAALTVEVALAPLTTLITASTEAA
jgi:hypothetical protein